MISIEIIVLCGCVFSAMVILRTQCADGTVYRHVYAACAMNVVQESKLPVHGVKNASVVFKLSGFYLHTRTHTDIKMYVSGGAEEIYS